MPPTPEPTATERLISQAFSKRLEIATAIAEFDKLQAQIVALGKGKHSGVDPAHVVTVVAATEASTGAVSYALAADSEEKARELAGEEFKALFDRTVTYSPCDGFEKVAPKLLTPAKARDLVALCLVPGKTTNGKKAYILWPKA